MHSGQLRREQIESEPHSCRHFSEPRQGLERMTQKVWHQITQKLNWYLAAVHTLGLCSLVRLQVEKRFAHGPRLSKLTSRLLLAPVYARPGSSDFRVFDQIFVEAEYRCLDQIKPPDLIIDCGANVGYSSVYFLSRFPSCFVISIEPDIDNFALLNKNLRPYQGRYEAIRAAVWPSTEPLRFLKPFCGPGKEWARRVERAPSSAEPSDHIETVDLPTLIRLSGFGRISLLKIDIEGAELELFSTDSGQWLPFVDNIVIELHGEGCSRAFFDAVKSYRFTFSKCGELTVCLETRNDGDKD
jgi:FkbM family methyltransferase